MSARPRVATNLAAVGLAVGVLALGAWWWADRAHRWERPAWRHRSFVPLRGEAGASPGTTTWVMAVNPRCPHCLTALVRLHAAWRTRAPEEKLVSLIVDTPVRPEPRTLRAVPTEQIWWDRDGIWRRRWGHRLYGELMRFDAAGRWVATHAPGDVPDVVSTAPALVRKGGS